jgi:hypothetical protein
MTKKILTVTEVSLTINEKTKTLKIEATGEVNSSGWTNPKLAAYIYVKPPSDGIYEYDFIADEPTGPASDVITKIKAEDSGLDFPSGLKGVKVYSSCNFITERLAIAETFLPNALDGGELETVTPTRLTELKKKNDLFSITNAFIWEDVLLVTVRYGGGCKKHDFKLVWDGSEMESNPAKIDIVLIHNANGDNCKALLTEELQFRLTPARTSNTILRLEGWAKEILLAMS